MFTSPYAKTRSSSSQQVLGRRGPSDTRPRAGSVQYEARWRSRKSGLGRLPVSGIRVGQRAADGTQRRPVSGHRGRDDRPGRIVWRQERHDVRQVRGRGAPETGRRPRRRWTAAVVVALVSAVERGRVGPLGSREQTPGGRVPAARAPSLRRCPPPGVRPTFAVRAAEPAASAWRVVLQRLQSRTGRGHSDGRRDERERRTDDYNT